MIDRENRIMVIDDDIQVRESVSLSLETAGYVVMVAESSRNGLHLQKKFQASLIIMDVVALMDGEEDSVSSSLPHSPTIPMITLTGNLPSSDKTGKGFSQHVKSICTLQKPFTVDELLQSVQRALPY